MFWPLISMCYHLLWRVLRRHLKGNLLAEIEKQNRKTDQSALGVKAGTSPVSISIGLEEIVSLANQIGLEYAEAKKESERLELLKPTMKSQIALRLLKAESMSEVKLRRLTETDPEYVEYIEKMVDASAKADKLKVRYDSYKNLFDAKRSLISYQKAEMKLL